MSRGSDLFCVGTRDVRDDDMHRPARGHVMNEELHQEADRILMNLARSNGSGARRLLGEALSEVQKAVASETNGELVLWASKQRNYEDVSTALFVSCTAMVRLIEKWQPSRFASADRLLLSARHVVARNRRTMAAPAMIA